MDHRYHNDFYSQLEDFPPNFTVQMIQMITSSRLKSGLLLFHLYNFIYPSQDEHQSETYRSHELPGVPGQEITSEMGDDWRFDRDYTFVQNEGGSICRVRIIRSRGKSSNGEYPHIGFRGNITG